MLTKTSQLTYDETINYVSNEISKQLSCFEQEFENCTDFQMETVRKIQQKIDDLCTVNTYRNRCNKDTRVEVNYQ